MHRIILISIGICIVSVCNFISSGNCDVLESNGKDPSLNEIPVVTRDETENSIDNTIPTIEPHTSDDADSNGDAESSADYKMTTESKTKMTTVKPSSTPPDVKTTADNKQAHKTTTKPRATLDPIDQYLLDGLLHIVDEKFGTISKRMMALEKSISSLQYYNVRSFRVVNTHLHAVDTILHGMTTEINQVEIKSRDIEQGISSVKNEMADLQTMNNGMFQAIEQNLVHFHDDIKSRLSEFKTDLDVTNDHVAGMKNDTTAIKAGIELVRLNQNALATITDDINLSSAETAHSASLLVNVTLGILQESATSAIHMNEIVTTLETVSKNVTDIKSVTEEIKNEILNISPCVRNTTVYAKDEDVTLSSSGEVIDDTNTQEMRAHDTRTYMACSKMFEMFEEKMKTIRPSQNTSCRIADSEDFKNDSKTLLKALSVVNENVLQSVTLYRHAGDLIERVISETEFIANEQVKLRGDIQDFLVNNTLYLEFLSQINQTIDLSKASDVTTQGPIATETPQTGKTCDVPHDLLDEVSKLMRNSTELVELLTNLAETSSTTLKEGIGELKTEVTKLHKIKQDQSKAPRYSKANLARDDPTVGRITDGALKDLQNRTDWIYQLVEAVASNTGWIPYVFHTMRFIESQVNKTLKLSTEISDRTEETLIRQRIDSKVFNRVTEPPGQTTPLPTKAFVKTTETTSTTVSSTASSTSPTPVPTKLSVLTNIDRKPSGDSLRCSNLTDEFGQMMEYVYETNIKIDRLIPALTHLLGEPEPYITLVGGDSDREGRVEIYYKGTWGTVCEPLSHIEASYICRSLGFLGGVAAENGFFGAGTGSFWNLNVTCLRSRYCDAVKPVIDLTKCDHAKDASVICEHMIRLISEDDNESQRHTGKLEIFHDNHWSPVCAKGWGRDETSVVCRQLGFHEGSASAVKDDSLVSTYWMNNVTCKGHENRLDACAFDGFRFDACPDFKHVSLICT